MYFNAKAIQKQKNNAIYLLEYYVKTLNFFCCYILIASILLIDILNNFIIIVVNKYVYNFLFLTIIIKYIIILLRRFVTFNNYHLINFFNKIFKVFMFFNTIFFAR